MRSSIFEETSSSRKCAHPSSRKRHLLENVRIHFRENAIFSKMCASIFEKTKRSEVRRPAMHPSGVQFGLSKGLLQLQGEQVLLSDQLLEAISVEAQLRVSLGKPAIDGNFLVAMTVQAAQNALGSDQTGRRQEIVPFFAGLNRVMYYSLCRVAERAGLAYKEPNKLFTNPEFWSEFSEKAVDVKVKGKSIPKIQKSLFKVCLELVRKRYTQTDPDNNRHADLIALFMFNFWNSIGLLPMTQALVIAALMTGFAQKVGVSDPLARYARILPLAEGESRPAKRRRQGVRSTAICAKPS
jgi:hypothetical protein